MIKLYIDNWDYHNLIESAEEKKENGLEAKDIVDGVLEELDIDVS